MCKTKDPKHLRVLFIGNSATYVNDIPGTLVALAQKAGYSMEADSIVKGGATLSYHADPSTEHGARVYEAIKQGYDLVFLQDNGNCISTEEAAQASLSAFDALAEAIRSSGARVGVYFRPPYGYEKWGFSPLEQCERIDEHFLKAASKLSSLNVFVNRAFARAIKETDIRLWAEDNGHTSIHGAYLAVCVFFAAIFNTPATVLDFNGIPKSQAQALQSIADEVASASRI